MLIGRYLRKRLIFVSITYGGERREVRSQADDYFHRTADLFFSDKHSRFHPAVLRCNLNFSERRVSLLAECHIERVYGSPDSGFDSEKKGNTSYGVACAACRIVSAIAGDTREIMPVSIVLEGEYGINGFAISTPCLIGRNGVEAVKKIVMNEYETEMFQKSAAVITGAVERASSIWKA